MKNLQNNFGFFIDFAYVKILLLVDSVEEDNVVEDEYVVDFEDSEIVLSEDVISSVLLVVVWL